MLKGKKIDNYWNSVIGNSPIYKTVTKTDEQALENLLDVQIVHQPNESDLGLRFIFKPNSYFNETSITRYMRVRDGMIIGIDGDQVTWKPNVSLTHLSKKVTNKSTGETKIVQGKKIESFFDIFTDLTADEAETLSRASNIMSELGTLIVKDSLEYFLGLIDIDESDDSEDGDFDDEEEEVEEAPKKKQKK